MFNKYLIYGLGISGLNVAKYLIKENQNVILVDDNENALESAKSKLSYEIKNYEDKIKFLKNSEIENILDKNDAIIFSPGIPLFFPKRHKILDIIEKSKAQIFCDIELFYLLNKNHNFIGITGTNGKSTSSALIDFILNYIKIKSLLAGNIGIACFELMLQAQEKKFDLNEKNNFVLEISSYQLDLMSKTHFDVAALSNITIDHIDHHGNFENYVLAKKNIFKNQNENDFAVIGFDNENSRKVFFEFKNDKNFKAQLIPFSASQILDDGISVIDGILYNNISRKKTKHNLQNLVLKGKHNMENIALAFACVYCLLLKNNSINEKIENEIIEAIRIFKGLRHRMQFLGNIDGINFVNDSKATNAESSERALESYKNIFWILGGKAKEGGILILKPYFNRITKAYLIGESSKDFAKFLAENNVKYEECENLKNAFNQALIDAKNSDLEEKNIILSPACASFDQWKNFEERGDYFCKLFDEIKK